MATTARYHVIMVCVDLSPASRGALQHALEELLLGSTADRVLRRSSVPVLRVPARRRRR